MPPINLWPTLAVTAGFAIFFSAGAALWIADRWRARRATGTRSRPVWVLVLFAALAAGCWISVYRIFHPL